MRNSKTVVTALLALGLAAPLLAQAANPGAAPRHGLDKPIRQAARKSRRQTAEKPKVTTGTEAFFETLKWRNIGPDRGGRSIAATRQHGAPQ